MNLYPKPRCTRGGAWKEHSEIVWACRYWFGKLKPTKGFESGKSVRNKKGFNPSNRGPLKNVVWLLDIKEDLTTKDMRTVEVLNTSDSSVFIGKTCLHQSHILRLEMPGARIIKSSRFEEIFMIKSNSQLSTTTLISKPLNYITQHPIQTPEAPWTPQGLCLHHLSQQLILLSDHPSNICPFSG